MFLEVCREFAGNTSMHGIKYVVDRNKSWPERVFWAVIVLLGASGSLYMGSLFWTRYINKPTLTRIETTYAPTSAIPFPAVTVCTSNRLSQTKIDKFITELNIRTTEEKDAVTRAMPQLLAFSPRVRPFNEKDMQVLHQVLVKNNIIDPGVMIKQISNSCDEVLEKCSWQGEVVNCSSIFADTLTPDGLCCSFNYNESEIATRTAYTHYTGFEMGLTMLINPMLEPIHHSYINSMGIEVIFHQETQYPGLLMSRKTFSVGRQTFLQLSGTLLLYSEDLKVLPYSSRNCLYSNERQLNFFSQYTQLSCRRECVVFSIVNVCKCLPYFYFKLAGPIAPICNVTDMACMASLSDVRRGKTPCDCPATCEEIIYTIISTAAPIVNEDFVTWPFMKGVTITNTSVIGHVFFKSPRQTILRTHMLTPTVYLLSSFGGIFCLFLGLSFITVLEVIYYFVVQFLIKYKQRGYTLNKQDNKAVLKQPKKFLGTQRRVHIYNKKKAIHTICK